MSVAIGDAVATGIRAPTAKRLKAGRSVGLSDQSGEVVQGFGDNTQWVTAEADRSVTTFLLPTEY
jgi:hypothetical protein